jgi:hypothetical protein
MRSSIVAAVVALSCAAQTFASGANAAQVDYFNKTHPLAANAHLSGGGGGSGSGKAGTGGGTGKVIHCAPGPQGKACHRP